MTMAMGCSAAATAAATVRCAPARSVAGGRAAAGNKSVVAIGGGAHQARIGAVSRRHHSARCSRSRSLVVAAADDEESVGERVLNEKGSAEEEAAGLAAVRASLEASGDCPPCSDETALWFLRDRRGRARVVSVSRVHHFVSPLPLLHN